METITITPQLNGYVKVSIEVARECLVFVWKMSVAQAQADAEEIVQRMGR